MKAYTAIAAFLMAPVSVAAAAGEQTPFMAAARALAEACASRDIATSPMSAMMGCQHDIASMAALRAQYSGAEQRETDFSWVTSSRLYSTLSAAYEGVDGMRTARVCEALETAWLHLGNVAEDAGYDQRGTWENMETLRLCRTEYGAWSWSRPLP